MERVPLDPVDAVSAAFGPRPELRGSPAPLILCVHRGFRGQEPLEDLHVALFGRTVERSLASGPARRELPGLPFNLLLGDNTGHDPTWVEKMNASLAQLVATSFGVAPGPGVVQLSHLQTETVMRWIVSHDSTCCG